MDEDNSTTLAPNLIRRAEAMRMLGISAATFHRWRAEGRLVPVDTARPGVWLERSQVEALRVSRGVSA